MSLSRVTTTSILLIIIGIVLLTPRPQAALDNNVTQQAQTAFNEGHYDEAIKLYEQLAGKVPGNSDVLYNLGTAYARAGQRGFAIWRYLQAMRISPRDRDLRYNLELLAPGIFQQLAVTPIPPVNWVYHCFTTNEWSMVASLAATVAMLLGALYFFRLHRSPHGPAVRTTVLALLIFAAIAYPFAFMHYFNEDEDWRGVVVTENTVARVAPSATQTETDALPVGTVLRILESTQSGWLKFSYAGGRMGFVEKERVRSL